MPHSSRALCMLSCGTPTSTVSMARRVAVRTADGQVGWAWSDALVFDDAAVGVGLSGDEARIAAFPWVTL